MQPASTSSHPRPRFLLSSIILLACATISCLLIAILGQRIHQRIDLTSTRQFTLSERTRLVLNSITEPTTIVVSADLFSLDRDTRLQMNDLLDEFGRVSTNIQSTWIDTGAASAQTDFTALIASLAQPQSAELAKQKAALESVAEESAWIAGALRVLSDRLKSLAESQESLDPAARTNMHDQAGLVRTIAASLDPVHDFIRAAANHSIGGVSLPAVDTARDAAAEPLQKAARTAAALAEFATNLPRTSTGEIRNVIRTFGDLAAETRDRAARAADHIASPRPPDALIIARVLQHTSAVLVTSSRGTIALDFATLFPSSALVDHSTADPRDTLFIGEQMISTALGALTQPVAPIAVFVHAQAVNLLDDRGEPTPPALGAFRKLFDRLRLTRTTPAEWAVASQALPPNLSSLDPAGNRPVVWIVLGAPPRTNTDARQSGALADRNARIAKLGAAVRSLIDSGEHLLVCVEPSDLPSIGEPDPVARELAPLGLTIDSARPIIRRDASPQGTMTWTYHSLSTANPAHPIGRAIDGLRIILPWASSIQLAPTEGVTASPLLSLPSGDNTWGESQWMLLRDAVGRGLARPLEPLFLAESPTVDKQRDTLPNNTTGFTVAAAAERARTTEVPSPHTAQSSSPQRLVVVASPEWLHDGYTQAAEEVSGRRVFLFPGNLELFDASLAWLAGRDDQIAPGPQSRDIPRIKPIPDGTLRLLRILLIVGLPALPLILAGLRRLIRG